MRVLGTTWGDPRSPSTYSGVPYHLYRELEQRGELAGGLDLRLPRPGDLFTGAIDLQRSLAARRLRRSAIWRYLPETIERLSHRLAAAQHRMEPHDATVQFGVGGIPEGPLVTHVEIPVATAMRTTEFARSYGFDELDDRVVARAIEGERRFLSACDVVWTNTSWTAAELEGQGVPASKLVVRAPASGVGDPGPIERDWSRLHLLFIGKDWVRKGGPLLLEAHAIVRARRPDAKLTIIGCQPEVDQAGVEVLGFLDKQDPADERVLERALRDATVFAMPSAWESFGIVYMEAALYGLPAVMLAGQGREDLFPPTMAIALSEQSPELLATALVELADDPERMRQMGEAGRAIASDRFMWPVVADAVEAMVSTALASRASR